MSRSERPDVEDSSDDGGSTDDELQDGSRDRYDGGEYTEPTIAEESSEANHQQLDDDDENPVPWWACDIVREIQSREVATKLKEWAQFTSTWATEKGINANYNFAVLLQSSQLFDLRQLKKEKEELTILVALWVVFLRVMKINLGNDACFKYKSVPEFLEAYGGHFDKQEAREQAKLMETANWMAILLPMVVAKKSKGLVIQIVPKLVEGFGVKYVTGSGQSKKTSDRVYIFEHEGNVQPCKKRKWGVNKDRDPLDIAPRKRTDKQNKGRPMTPAIATIVAAIERQKSTDEGFESSHIEKFRRESFYSGPTALMQRQFSEDFSQHFDVDLDKLL